MTGYVPLDREQRREMLQEVGVDLEHLFDIIPKDIRLDAEREYPNLAQDGLSEMEVAQKLNELAAKNHNTMELDSYLGAGIYEHFQPSAVRHLINRQEFLTAYTPYQAEVSQGTLQAIFEWQSYICRLTGLEVSNSSMYDGASSAAEALLMACRTKRRNKVFVSEGVNPETIGTIKTYFHAAELEVEIGALDKDGKTKSHLPSEKGEYAAILVQSPNYFGVVEDLAEIASKAKEIDAVSVASCDLISLALLKNPGEQGIDIAVGEAQALGIPQSFGGPAVGYLAATEKFLRRMPGRIAGETVDRDGKRAYVLTIQAREQHIRREKATSNICTNQALLATAATIYLAMNGRSGLREVAEQSAAKAIYLCEKLVDTGLFTKVFDSPFFREFALRPKDGIDLAELNKKLLDNNILGGHVLPGNIWLLAVTEVKTKDMLDRFVEAVSRLAQEVKK